MHKCDITKGEYTRGGQGSWLAAPHRTHEAPLPPLSTHTPSVRTSQGSARQKLRAPNLPVLSLKTRRSTEV